MRSPAGFSNRIVSAWTFSRSATAFAHKNCRRYILAHVRDASSELELPFRYRQNSTWRCIHAGRRSLAHTTRHESEPLHGEETGDACRVLHYPQQFSSLRERLGALPLGRTASPHLA